ncbi:MAG: xylose isomerase [Opitutus sp.]
MKTTSTSPRLVMCAATWSMIAWPSARKEWSLGKKLTAIKQAGFDGVCGYISPELKKLAKPLGLELMSGFDAKSVAGAMPRLIEQRDLGVRFINIQLLNHDTAPAVAARTAVKLIAAAEKLGLAVHIETHRDTATETPEKFDAIARGYRAATGKLLPVTWDHSHFAVSKHMLPPEYSKRLLAWPKLIQHSQMFHLRPFNSQHLQIPVTNGRGALTREFKDYIAFVEDLFALWLRGPRPGNELWVCPELGMSHGYQVSINPHAWPEAVRARTEMISAWNSALKRVSGAKQK